MAPSCRTCLPAGITRAGSARGERPRSGKRGDRSRSAPGRASRGWRGRLARRATVTTVLGNNGVFGKRHQERQKGGVVQRLTVNGVRRDITIGPFDLVLLAEARMVALQNRRVLREGKDPIAERRRGAVPTFREAAGDEQRPARACRAAGESGDCSEPPRCAKVGVSQTRIYGRLLQKPLEARNLGLLRQRFLHLPTAANRLRRNISSDL